MPFSKELLRDIAAANERLAGAGVPVRLRIHRKSLYLRCSRLPPKLGHEAGHRYELAQGPASAPVVRRAEAQAHGLWAAVVERRFSWEEFDPNHKAEADTVAAWVERLKVQHLSTGQCSPQTWAKHWQGAVFSKMPQDARLTQAEILAAVLQTKENTRGRRRACQALARLAEVAGIEVDLRPYQGRYGSSQVQRRDLPTDQQIEDWYAAMGVDPPWQIIFARLVVFGLRPSEAFGFELVDQYTARVVDAKSGRVRETKAFHPYWADRWPVVGQLPQVTWRKEYRAKDLTERVRSGLQRRGVTCQRYDLRHAWCVRVSVEYKIPTSLAARWAGHSEAVHNATYLQWIRADQGEAVYRAMALGKKD
ncbi:MULTISPECIES: hypothetical protein [Cyanophyceae]|uniref:hypothetical protein n=1 Tax=Cyanophyceae TaxID=3028117 RepID=UPI001685FBB0|nr:MULTISPECIES: hypothetical protein [Cyanophyceae]MBD1918915.1 hypothetical protein [Phormidium sp. FACHB-77]MBD2033243.1 hypothetical protein [Phormidium sp. FACHB-322]MBD2053824.1 hypothetical protein [Leptolyngbya sp. FACHB-60]